MTLRVKVIGFIAGIIGFLSLLSCGNGEQTEQRVVNRPGNADVVSLNEGWRFARYGLQAEGTRLEEPEGLFKVEVDDADWEQLSVPHDFAIKGPFRMDLAGNTGRLPFQGIGWYRKTFTVDKADKGKRFYIDFDGVMAYAKVWLNGEYVGTWPYGYSSFRLDLTPYVKVGEENVLAVRTDTEKWDSRWYPGAGIYRNVWLVKTGQVHVKHWGTKVVTDHFQDNSVQLNLTVEVENKSDKPSTAVVKAEVYEVDKQDNLGKRVLRFSKQQLELASQAEGKLQFQETWKNFKRWDIDSPNRYMARVVVEVDGQETEIHPTVTWRVSWWKWTDRKRIVIIPRSEYGKSLSLAKVSSSTGVGLKSKACATIMIWGRWGLHSI